MSPASPAWTVIGVLLASERSRCFTGAPAPRRPARRGAAYRWLAAAVRLGRRVRGPGRQRRLGDADRDPAVADRPAGAARPAAARDRPDPAGPARRSGVAFDRLADGAPAQPRHLRDGWIAILRSAYASAAVGGGSFAVDLIHPVADLVVLGGTLAVAMRAGARRWRRTWRGGRATLGDLLAVQARAVGAHAGAWPQLAWLVAICLLGAAGVAPGAPLPPTCGARPAGPPRGPRPRARIARPAHSAAPSSTAIGLTAAVSRPRHPDLRGRHLGPSGPVPLIAGCALTLALAARARGLLLQTRRSRGSRPPPAAVPPAGRPDQ